MPYAIDLPIAGREKPPMHAYRALHANLLKWIAAADPEMAAAVHDRPVRKPFTVSALMAEGETGDWHWRVTLLDDILWETFWVGLQAVGVLDIDGRAYPVRWPDARITHQSYDALLTGIRPATQYRMAFVSPTAFSAGELDMPLPEPSAVVHSWLSRWNEFAPAVRRIDVAVLDVVHACVGITAIDRMYTRTHDLGRGRPPVGFLGEVTFAITKARSLNQAHVWQLNALADYAPFCGTGRKTTLGMGQTRRL